MLRTLIYIAVVFLIVDHLYTHWGPEIVNRAASTFMGRPVTVVEKPPHRESVLDRIVKKVRETLGR
jgi:hypothetical protein